MTAARLALELVRAEIRERALPPATALAHLKAALDADDGGDPLRTRLIAVELLLRSWLEEQRGGDGALSAPEWNRLEELCAQLGRTAPGDDPARGALKILRAERHLRLGDTRASTYNESRTENESGDAMRAKQKIGMLAMTTMLLACGGESQKVEAGDQGAERPTGFEGLIGDGPQKPETGGKTGAGSGPGTAGIGGKVGSGGAGSADALPAGPLPTLTDNSVAALVEADFAKASVEDQKDLRYLSFAHLGETDPVEVETLRIGVEKLLNSLSMADDIVRLEPVGSARSVYKMRLSRYEWTAATWQRVEGGEHAAGNVERLASGAVLAKADWLVFSATRPEVYDRILELPPLESMLESRLGVDRSKAIYLGVSTSIVAKNGRILERTPAKLKGKDTYYWRSYDFLGTGAAREALTKGDPWYAKGRSVANLIAGEFIFSLPNGLHAYYLSGFGAQHRFDAQLSVANDPARADKLVINGESCFRCHAGGLNIRVDEVGLQLAPGSAARAYYPEPSKLAAQFQQDNAQYRGALKKLGYDEAMGEPIDRVIRTFKQDRGVEDIREQAGETDAVFGG